MRLIGASSSTTRIAASATRPSCRHESEIRFEGGEIEPVRRLPSGQEVLREDRVRLVAVAIPELPRHLLEPPPGDDRHASSVVGDDVDRMPTPPTRLAVTGQ